MTRNYLTHHDEKKAKWTIPPRELAPYDIKLRLILLACLLSEIGFEQKEIDLMIRKYTKKFNIFDA